MSFIFCTQQLHAEHFFHPYYVSITEIRIDTREQTLQVSCRMFMDDLEEAISKLYDLKVDILTSIRFQSLNDVFFQYIRQHLSIQIGGVFQQPQMLGYEIEEEAVWCYLELKNMKETGPIKIINTILYDFIPSQTNIIHCYYNGVRKSLKLVNPESKAMFEY
ncbi:MAG: hypothetical protein N2167_04680 [Flavobacteriales bacterium]|nr:hypothetical protein [Flavobacteriales bacterium]